MPTAKITFAMVPDVITLIANFRAWICLHLVVPIHWALVERLARGFSLLASPVHCAPPLDNRQMGKRVTRHAHRTP